jgi:hypothetical protein
MNGFSNGKWASFEFICVSQFFRDLPYQLFLTFACKQSNGPFTWELPFARVWIIDPAARYRMTFREGQTSLWIGRDCPLTLPEMTQSWLLSFSHRWS